MMMIRRVPTVALSVLCVACSATKWQQPGEIRPSTYQMSEERIKRSVGKLRRLAITPIRYEHVKDGTRVPDKELPVTREWSSMALSHLRDWKGYEVAPLELYDDMYPQKLGRSRDEIDRSLEALAKWAKDSPDGEPPPAEVVSTVNGIGRALNTDGLVIVQGFRREPSTWNVALVILSASLTWPLLAVEGYFEMRADLYEVETGRIVWRHRISERRIDVDDHWPPRSAMQQLFDPIEQALPRALIDR